MPFYFYMALDRVSFTFGFTSLKVLFILTQLSDLTAERVIKLARNGFVGLPNKIPTVCRWGVKHYARKKLEGLSRARWGEYEPSKFLNWNRSPYTVSRGAFLQHGHHLECKSCIVPGRTTGSQISSPCTRCIPPGLHFELGGEFCTMGNWGWPVYVRGCPYCCRALVQYFHPWQLHAHSQKERSKWPFLMKWASCCSSRIELAIHSLGVQ